MRSFLLALFSLTVSSLWAQAPLAPVALRTDLLLHTDKVWQRGFLTTLTPETAPDSLQMALVRSERPSFSWQLPDTRTGYRQTAWQLVLSSSRANCAAGRGDVWDSGNVPSDQSVGVLLPAGRRLQPNRVYYWKIRVWDDRRRASPYSAIRVFRTAPELADYATSHYPLVKEQQKPARQRTQPNGARLYDFSNDAFGQVWLTAQTTATTDSLVLHLGEALTPGGAVQRKPPGTIRYRRLILRLRPGTHTYPVPIPPDKRNTGPKAIMMPGYIGEVLPFRYIELERPAATVQVGELVRHVVTYPFDDTAATFGSSDTTLNRVWALCKHTIKATSFTGYYVDGDRERIPYEADALINQLAHYATDGEYTMAKRSLDYLIFHATWPTEWSLQNVLIAWNDYRYSGDARNLTRLYTDLSAKLLLPLARPDGLISTRTGLQTPAFKASIHYETFDGRPTLQDIVDWPQQGVLGLGKREAGETDGFVFCDYNAVVNAFHYQALRYMADLADQLGQSADAAQFRQRGEQVKRAYQATFIDPATGLVADGDSTRHASLHANMMALAVGLVPEANRARVLAHIRSRGMACSVYGAQFLLDALYNAHEADYALSLLTSTAERSWYNMIRTGSTMTTEAWDTRYKPNQDWNHAWGAAPANVIVRKLMGVEPLTPAFGVIQVKPQPGALNQASLQLPTLHGPVRVAFTQRTQRWYMRLTLPANSRGVVYVPRLSPTATLWQNGRQLTPPADKHSWQLTNVPSGTHQWEVRP
ncbi:alpha-L-rhamnosidase [Fibrella aestuarina BUZ 2]|uniref:alpha-L-rhamnosidase n=1 Tax=Fibrella aestuarina BUZ 2 TaxID=1166018 RepID=I0K6D0_9BACT|nr:alpha-L-rhamnosidase C-terminal domain-containing protein [Fibrella aestuarina]CCG99683.1 alpha-L-rhamnosidase [Fibrella aestuarina BUZ 2]